LIAGIGQVAYKVWYGEQKGYLSNIFPAFSQILGLCAVAIAMHFHGRLESLILCYLIPPALFGMFSLGKLWMEHSAVQESRGQEMKPLLRNALAFGGFSFLASAVLLVDLPIISQYLPPRQIATYAVVSRVFAFVFLIYTSALLALWPVCAEHLAVHDWEPVKRSVRNYIMGGCVIVVVFTLAVAAKLSLIASIIAPGARLEVPVRAMLAFGIYYIVRVWTDTYAMVLQSRSHLRPLWISTPIQAILSVVLQIALIQRLGLQGAVWGMIGSFLFTAAWILPWSVIRMRIADGKRPEVMRDEIGAMISDL
jgi:O-antigen/teichoic acid export membrane protein